MPNYSSRLRIGTALAANDVRPRGILSQVIYRQTWTAPITAISDGHLDGKSNAAAGSTTTIDGALGGVNTTPRACRIVSNGTNTGTVTITGLDVYGHVISEVLTSFNTAAVQGKVAFKTITLVAWEISTGTATTFDLGANDVLGLDYKMETDNVFWELLDGVEAAAGVVVAGSSAANADRRGTYDPNSVLNGARDFDIFYVVTDIDFFT